MSDTEHYEFNDLKCWVGVLEQILLVQFSLNFDIASCDTNGTSLANSNMVVEKDVNQTLKPHFVQCLILIANIASYFRYIFFALLG